MGYAVFPRSFGRYTLTERLALGGMAELFLADVAGAHGFQKTVVIKRILPHLAADEQFTAMFIAEAKLTARLDHPKIAQTYELGTERDQLYIAMEYIDGLDALALLRECAHRRVRVPAHISVYVIKEVLDALDFAHKQVDGEGAPLGIVHRDISPSNILLSRRGDVKLVDFGIAHAARDEKTKAGTLKGKYGYMSPEQVMGGELDARSDLFSVGIVLAELLMGRRLFAAPNELDVLLMVRDVDLQRLDRFGSKIDGQLEQLVRWALRKNIHDRFQDAAEFRDRLDEWLFEKRYRVTGKNVAEVVDALYYSAAGRRRAQLEASSSVQEPRVSAAGEIHESRAERMEHSAAVGGSSVPVGYAAATSGLSSRESIAAASRRVESSNSVSPSELDIGAAELSDFVASLAEGAEDPEFSQRTGTERDVAVVDDDQLRLDEDPPTGSSPLDLSVEASDRNAFRKDSPVDLGGLGSELLDLATDRAPVDLSGAATSNEILTDMPAAILDLGDLRATASAVAEIEASASYSSISEAVASVEPQALDPASRDFDDSDVDSRVASLRRARETNTEQLARVDRPTPTTLQDQDHGHPDKAGSLADVGALSVLFGFTSSRADGLLVMSVGGIRKEIYFKRGVPEYVSSNVATELFGAYLVSSKVLSAGELDMALAVMPHFGGKLGDTLVGLGLMKPLDVFRHLTRQVRQKLIDVVSWVNGTYTWYPGRDNPRASFPLDLDPLEVYGAGAMALSRDVVDGWVDKNSARKPKSVSSAKIVPELFQLGPETRKVWTRLDGQRDLQDFAKADGLNEEQRLKTLRLLYLLTSTGLAELL